MQATCTHARADTDCVANQKDSNSCSNSQERLCKTLIGLATTSDPFTNTQRKQ
ncbi:hypothetical protein Plhal304r1_c072g0160771 [Plasmopara halstedii]